MKKIKFTINEKPLGVNHVYATSRYGYRFLISKGKKYKENIGWHAKQTMWGKEMFQTPKVTLDFYFDRKRTDIDGPIKLILDSMNGVVYQDDSQILELHTYKNFDKENPRTEITVEEYKSKLSNL